MPPPDPSQAAGIRTVGTLPVTSSRDPNLSMRDVQTILGHTHLATTAEHYLIEEEAEVIRRVAQHLVDRQDHADDPPTPVAVGYDTHDLNVLFGLVAR